MGDYSYFLSREVLEFTEDILGQYGALQPPNEGIVFWAGNIEKEGVYINSAIAPDTDSTYYHVIVKVESMIRFVSFLSENGIKYIGQVHSHPGDFINHSPGDDELLCFKRDGLISIVAPNFGQTGIYPFKQCGFHKYSNGDFLMLSKRYVSKKFKVVKMKSTIDDMRNKIDARWKEKNGID